MQTPIADIEVVDFGRIEAMKRKAWAAPNRRDRICLSEYRDGVQEMVIVLYQDSYIRPHRHPLNKSESYHVIEGELEVRIFNEDGSRNRTIKLDKQTPLYRMKNGWFHQPVSLTPVSVYHEALQGPFNKEIDVEYASWAKEE